MFLLDYSHLYFVIIKFDLIISFLFLPTETEQKLIPTETQR